MSARFDAFRQEAPRWVRYLYFMRFSLALWLFPLFLVLLNIFATKALTSGLLVPEFLQGYMCVGFFLASTGYVALIAARVVAINGPERWGEADNPLPTLLKKLLVNDRGEHETAAVIVSQLPNIFVFAYLYWNATVEAVAGWRVWTGLLSGAALAFIFWYGANAWYYLNYKVPQRYKSVRTMELGKNAARTILLPRSWFFPYTPGKSDRAAARKNPKAGVDNAPLVRLSIEEASTEQAGNWAEGFLQWIAKFLARYFDPCGYLYPDGRLYEAHIFSSVAVTVFFVLYLVIWPLAAPVRTTVASVVALTVTALAVVRVVWIFWKASGISKGLLWWKIALMFGVVGFWAVIAGFYFFTNAERFPILAIVLIMVIALCWTFAGIAFFVDRYRVPVVTLIVLFMIAPRLAHLDRFPHYDHGFTWRGHEEHYLSTVATAGAAKQNLQTPSQILDGHLQPGDTRPLIIVTATGGGLHAAAWTAAVLAHLEEEFGPDFHKHLLLASTVSGGSVGLLTYLRILQDGSLDQNPLLALARMQSAAQCSSLEGVGWGLVYYDLPKAFVPLVPYFIPPSSGVGDLDHMPLGKDQTWSLRKSFGRNLNDAYCEELWAVDNHSNPNWDPGRDPNSHPEEALTLRALPPASAFPAFTMNTTTVEDGNRFLLANYRVSDGTSGSESDYRARSFLATFGGQDASIDLPLATAAQMSATFPYVSSAARVPLSIDNDVNSVHFVDGGYYDNDGTASAIEFLRYALAPGREARNEASVAAKKSSPTVSVPEPQKPPVRILLIEIRNSGDVSPGTSENEPDRTNSKYPWNLTDQANAPLLAFWQAGHESVTARNRVGLGMLRKALKDRLQLHHIVLADNDSDANAGTDPLNWSLTPKQRREVQKSANGLEPCYANAKSWFSNWESLWGKPAQPQVQGCDLKANAEEVNAVP
jgi:hypothetical protein